MAVTKRVQGDQEAWKKHVDGSVQCPWASPLGPEPPSIAAGSPSEIVQVAVEDLDDDFGVEIWLDPLHPLVGAIPTLNSFSIARNPFPTMDVVTVDLSTIGTVSGFFILLFRNSNGCAVTCEMSMSP